MFKIGNSLLQTWKCIEQMLSPSCFCTNQNHNRTFWSPDWHMFWSTEPTCPVSPVDWDFFISHVCPWALPSQWRHAGHVTSFSSPSAHHIAAADISRHRLQLKEQVPSLLSPSKLIGWISPGLAVTANDSCRRRQTVLPRTVDGSVTDVNILLCCQWWWWCSRETRRRCFWCW